VDECKPLGGGCHSYGGVQQPGRAVHVDPIKPALKAPGTNRLKLIYDGPLSNLAFKFNLRRYSLDEEDTCSVRFEPAKLFYTDMWLGYTFVAVREMPKLGSRDVTPVILGRAVQVDPMKPIVKAPGTKRLKL